MLRSSATAVNLVERFKVRCCNPVGKRISNGEVVSGGERGGVIRFCSGIVRSVRGFSSVRGVIVTNPNFIGGSFCSCVGSGCGSLTGVSILRTANSKKHGNVDRILGGNAIRGLASRGEITRRVNTVGELLTRVNGGSSGVTCNVRRAGGTVGLNTIDRLLVLSAGITDRGVNSLVSVIRGVGNRMVIIDDRRRNKGRLRDLNNVTTVLECRVIWFCMRVCVV